MKIIKFIHKTEPQWEGEGKIQNHQIPTISKQSNDMTLKSNKKITSYNN